MQCIQTTREEEKKSEKEEDEEKKYPICRELLLFEIFKTTFLSVIHLFHFFSLVRSLFLLSQLSLCLSLHCRYRDQIGVAQLYCG